jgi:hypothetical protein
LSGVSSEQMQRSHKDMQTLYDTLCPRVVDVKICMLIVFVRFMFIFHTFLVDVTADAHSYVVDISVSDKRKQCRYSLNDYVRGELDPKVLPAKIDPSEEYLTVSSVCALLLYFYAMYFAA